MAISRTYYEKKVRGGHITGLGTYWNHSWMHGKRTIKKTIYGNDYTIWIIHQIKALLQNNSHIS